LRRSDLQARAATLDLDLRPPVRLDLWAIMLALGVVAGTVAPPIGLSFALASLAVSAGALVWRDLVPEEWRMMAVLAPLFAAGGVGIALLHAATPDPLADLAALEPGEVVVVGQVTSPPVASGFGYRAEMRVEHLWYEEKEVLRGGGVQVFAGDLRGGVGDTVRVDGEISRPQPGEDGFDYARYLSTKNISAVINASGVSTLDEGGGWIGRIHRRTDVALGYGLRPEEAAIVRGMVLGDRSRIPEELEDAFRKSGITHILAISGQHVAVLAALVYLVLRAFALPVALRGALTLGLTWLYILVAGAPPSAIRAGVVATLALAAPIFGRQLSPLHFMTAMLAIVLAYNPELVYSTGFQLSVAAVFGILLLRGLLKSFVKSTVLRPLQRPPELLSELLSISLAAQIATAPIIALSFGEVSVIGALTNLVAVPLSGPVLTLGFLGALLGGVAPALAYPLNASNGSLVTVLELVAQGAAALPFAAVATPGAGLPLLALFYAGCVPAAVAGSVYPEESWTRWGGLLLLWTALWLALVAVLGG
jgi:competence protein ComEC